MLDGVFTPDRDLTTIKGNRFANGPNRRSARAILAESGQLKWAAEDDVVDLVRRKLEQAQLPF
jgi:hypothetical protein